MSAITKYVSLDEGNFEREVLAARVPVLVDFYADWCGPCRAVAPTIEQLATDFDGRATVGKVDVEAEAGLAGKYGIRSIPALLFFKDGEVTDQVVGAASKQVLAEKLEGLLAAGALSAVRHGRGRGRGPRIADKPPRHRAGR